MADQMVSDPYAHLRASASERAKHTVARTENGIRAIRARGETVTARSLERETGLTFKSIQRNVGAYELYKAAAKEVRGGSKRRARRPRHTRQDGSEVPMRDSLTPIKSRNSWCGFAPQLGASKSWRPLWRSRPASARKGTFEPS